MSFLHSQQARQRLRKWRPLYNKVFRRRKNLERIPPPSEQLRTMYGRGIFMFAFGRCGTTVFADLLASHPGVVNFGEVLNQESYHSFFQDFSRRTLRWWSFGPDLMEREFYAYLNRQVRKVEDRACLFDLKIESLHFSEGNWRLPGFEFGIFDALQDSGAPVILVERRDLVARHVSGKIAAARQAYHSYHQAKETRKVAPFRIDIDRMEQANALIRAQTAHIRTRFADYPRFETVVYEEMFETADDGASVFRRDLADRMGQLLDLDPEKFQRRPALARMSGGAEKNLILNMDEVEAARARQAG